MDGIATFLIGGVLGVALGYLASRKNPPKSQGGVASRTVEAPYIPSPRPDEPPILQPEAVEVAAPAAPEADAVGAEVVAEAAIADAIGELPAVEIELPEVEEAPAAESAVEAVAAAAAPAEPEPFVFEEPAEEVSTVATPEATEPVPSESTIEEMDGGVLAPAIDGEPTAAVDEETVIFGDIADEMDFIDMSAFEAAVTEPAQADLAIALPVTESIEPEVEETSALVEEAAPPEAPPVASPVDDLKARIEETRRRIRRELEQPFLSADEIQDVPDWTSTPAVRDDEPPMNESVVEGVVEPVVERVAEPEPVATESFEMLADMSVDEDSSSAAAEETADYASMKNRIEVTRSRLKAKAFDAMMTGESALLGRDPEDAQLKRPTKPTFDTEIDETIEAGLREQET